VTTPSTETRHLSVDRVSLRVSTRHGDRPGRPLLLCNGIGAPLELLDPLRDHLSMPTIAFDAPGAGESSTPAYPPTLRGVGRLVRGMLDQLGYAEVDVLGISWGGLLTQELARRDTRVRRIVLVSTAAGGLLVPGRPQALLALADTRRYDDPVHLARVATKLYGPEIVEDPSFLLRQAAVRQERPPSKRGYLYQQLALRRFGSALWLRKLTQPTLVLHGDSDPIVPAVNARILANLIPHAQLEIMSGGHLFALTKAEATARSIEAFLKGRA
jgi:poly(3-hydroxyalkanoate) depolymerase